MWESLAIQASTLILLMAPFLTADKDLYSYINIFLSSETYPTFIFLQKLASWKYQDRNKKAQIIFELKEQKLN